MFGHCLLQPRNTGLLAPLIWPGVLLGREGPEISSTVVKDRAGVGRKSNLLDSLRRSFSTLNLFILLWVGPSIFCVFFLFGIISYSLSRDDLFLNLLLERSSLICRVLTLSFQENWRQDLWITSGWREHDLCKNWMDAEMSKYSLLSSVHLLDPGDWWTGCLWE